MTASFSDLRLALTDLSLRKRLVLVHASPTVNANDLLESLRETTSGFIAPSYTPKTLLPLHYHPAIAAADAASSASIFTQSLAADKALGDFPELVRNQIEVRRSLHPVFSFVGIGADFLLSGQTAFDIYAPIAALAEEDGVVLLVGVDHRVNFSIHYGEKLAGRMQFIRWARTESGIAECPNFPGDSEGFNAITLSLKPFIRQAKVGGLTVQALPLKDLLRTVVNKIREDAYALLCARPDCERCEAVRWG